MVLCPLGIWDSEDREIVSSLTDTLAGVLERYLLGTFPCTPSCSPKATRCFVLAHRGGLTALDGTACRVYRSARMEFGTLVFQGVRGSLSKEFRAILSIHSTRYQQHGASRHKIYTASLDDRMNLEGRWVGSFPSVNGQFDLHRICWTVHSGMNVPYVVQFTSSGRICWQTSTKGWNGGYIPWI